jgi:hypothetical protein
MAGTRVISQGEGLVVRVPGRGLQQQRDEGHLLILVSHLGPNPPFLSAHLPVQSGVPFAAEAGQGELDKEFAQGPVQERHAGWTFSTLYLSMFLFHFYDHYNALTQGEKAQYTQAQAEVQELLAQGTILNPEAPELDILNQAELPLPQPVQRGYTIGAQLQWYTQTRHTREGSSQVGGSRQLTPKERSSSPLPHSPPTRKGSPMTGDSDAEDGNYDGAYKPSVPSSTRGKKWRPRSMTPEHPPKVPCNKKGLSTPVQGYHGQLSKGMAVPIPTPASSLLSSTPRFPSPSVPQRPILPQVTGTASHLVDLEQPTVDLKQPTVEPEQPPVDLDQYQWLFTKGKGKVKVPRCGDRKVPGCCGVLPERLRHAHRLQKLPH